MTYSNDVDVVSLIQLDAGAKLVEVKFFSASGLSSKAYTYKTDLLLSVGDVVLVQSGQGFGVARVVNTENVELTNGAQHKWIITVIEKHIIDRYKDLDQNLRKKLAMGKAIQEAKSFAEASGLSLESESVMPRLDYNVVSDAEVVVESPSSTPEPDDEIPF